MQEKILAKAINKQSKLKAVLHRIPEASRVQTWEYDKEKNKKAKIRRARQARQAAKLAAAAEPPALRPAAQLDEIWCDVFCLQIDK